MRNSLCIRNTSGLLVQSPKLFQRPASHMIVPVNLEVGEMGGAVCVGGGWVRLREVNNLPRVMQAKGGQSQVSMHI